MHVDEALDFIHGVAITVIVVVVVIVIRSFELLAKSTPFFLYVLPRPTFTADLCWLALKRKHSNRVNKRADGRTNAVGFVYESRKLAIQ